VNAARELKENNYELDQLAITVTKANARLVKAAIPGAVFFEDVGRATSYLAAGGRMVVMGGTTPGQTTDAVAALLAEDCGASRFVNLSNVPAIYTEDPAKDKHATRIPHMTHREFVSFVEKKVKQTPGQNFIVDQIAAKVLARSNIDAHFVKGTDMKQVVAAIKGQKHNGTVISG